MSLHTNENGTLKQLDVSQYQSAHFIDDSLFQDLTLAGLGFTAEMVAERDSSESTDSGFGAKYLKPFKTYTFDFAPKMVRVMQFPADEYMKKLTEDSGIYVDNPLHEYYCTTSYKYALGYSRYLDDGHYECSSMFFQASSVGCSRKPGSTNYNDDKPIFIGGQYGYCYVGSGAFCGYAGNASQYSATDIGTAFVWFGGKLQGKTFTLYAWASPRASRYTTADVLASRWMYGSDNGYPNHFKAPIFEFQVVGG